MEHHGQHPAPAVSAGPGEMEPSGTLSHDNAARLLGGTALLVAALAVTVAITRRRA